MLAYALSQILGLARWILMSRYFGTTPEADAFNAARQLSDILFTLVAGGALASAFIPTFTSFLVSDDRAGAWRLASAVANLVTLILTGLCTLAMIFAPFLVRTILAPDFAPPEQALTAALLRVVLPSAIIFGVSGLLMGVLNAHKRFLLPALASSMYWLGMIFGIVALRPWMGIFGVAWGAVIGSVLHLAIQLPGLARLPKRAYTFVLGLHIPEVREVIRLMGPRLFGVGVVQINALVNVSLASGMPSGSFTAIGQAFSIMTMPLFVVAQGIATASFPIFSTQAAAGKLDDMRISLISTLRGVIFLMMPASVGLILLRVPLVAFLFERGAFTHQSTEMVAWALLWYAAGLLGHSLIEVIYRAFYALHNTKTPVLIGASAMGLNVVFSLLFAGWFPRMGWLALGGLALANSLATMIEMIVALILIRHKMAGLRSTSLGSGALQAITASALMAMGVFAWIQLAAQSPPWLVTGVGVLLGGGIYVLVMVIFRVPETRLLWQALHRRLTRFFPHPPKQPLE